MKNSLVKIIGVVMTVAILAGLLVMSLPASVSAADLTWTTLTTPTMTVGTSANVYTFGPDGKTLYLYAALALNKSLDGGMTWTTTGLGVGLNGIAVTQIAVDQASPTNLVATDGTNLYRSNDSGADWYVFNPSPVPGTTITAVGITNGSSGAIDVLAGYKGAGFAGGVAYFDTNNGVWQVTGGALGGTSWGTADAETVAFSPSFASDLTIVAVAGNSANILVRTYIVASGAKWNGDIADGTIGVAANATTIASLAFASDFVPGAAATGKVFVGIGNTSGAAGDVYRMNGRTQNTAATLTSAVSALGLGTDVASIAFTGPVATGTIIAGDYNDNIIYNATTVSTVTSGATWNSSAQSPRAPATVSPNTLVMFAPTTTTLYAGTGGGTGSALSTSTDYNSFAGIAFVCVSGFANIQFPSGGLTGVGGVTQWQKTYDSGNAGGTYTLWKSIDSGATWKEIFENGNISFSVYLSPAFATDKTIYLTQTNAGVPVNKLIKSVDGGLTWSTVPVIGAVAPNAFAPIDTNNYWIGSPAGVRATNAAATIYLDGATPLAIIGLPGALLVWELSGEWWYSTDGGVTFTASGADDAIGFTGAFTFGFDGTHWTIYEVDHTNNIEKYTVGVDTAWSVYVAATSLVSTGSPATAGLINLNNGSNPAFTIGSISAAPGGVWYITSVGNTNAQIWRSTDLDTWEAVPGTDVGTFTSIISIPAVTAVANTAGNNVIYTAVAGAASTTDYGPMWKSFTDAVLAGPKITAPAANASVPAIVDITWGAVKYATQYDVQLAYDSAFTNLVPVGANNATTATTAGTILSQVSLVGGKPYYVRVRVSAGKPLASLWSTAVKFTTQLSSTGSLTSEGLDTAGRIYPTNGSVVTAATPSFTWGSVAGATSYDFKLSDKPDFSNTIDSTTGLTGSVYQTTVTLKPGTYFWEVRAVNGIVNSNWVQSQFTIAAPVPTGTATAPASTQTVTIPPVIVPTPNITVPPAQITVNNPTPNITVNSGGATTSTPAWTWVLIVIGAVLVIAVIVLIVRTRRI